MGKLVNLTPHAINVAGTDGEVVLTVPPGGVIARVTTSQEVVGNIDGIDVVKTTFGTVEGLPEPTAGTTYVVSSLVLGRCQDRDDVVAPDTGPTAIRKDGQVVAVRRFQR